MIHTSQWIIEKTSDKELVVIKNKESGCYLQRLKVDSDEIVCSDETSKEQFRIKESFVNA